MHNKTNKKLLGLGECLQMKGKLGVVISICALVVFTVFGIFTILYSGGEARGLGYVNIAVNPRIDFVSDREIVVSYSLINDEAKVLCAEEEFVGLNITDAVDKFLSLCLRAGYLEVENGDNLVLIECVSTLKQVLENKVYKTANDFLIKNQVLGVIVEASNDNAYAKRAKDKGVGVDLLSLIEANMRLNKDAKFDDLKNKTGLNLLTNIKKYQEINNAPENYSEAELQRKHELLEKNRLKYADHKNSITSESLRDFKPIFEKNKQELREEMRKDFNGVYEVWKTNHINFIS